MGSSQSQAVAEHQAIFHMVRRKKGREGKKREGREGGKATDPAY